MRILIVSNLFPPVVYGGYEQACANVAAELDRRGHDIQVLTSYAPAEVADPPYVARDLDIHWFVHPELPDPGARTLQLHAALCSSFLRGCL